MTPEKPPRVLIDLSNLHTGGGLQAGASLLDELAAMSADLGSVNRWPWLETMTVEASVMVIDNAATVDQRHPLVREVRGRPFDQVRRPRHVDYDVSFVLFGPDYAPRRATRRVVGFADGISLKPEFAMSDTLMKRMRLFARSRLSRSRFTHYERVVVEASHVAQTLGDRWGISPTKLSTVPNTVNAVFFDPQAQESITSVFPEGALFCFPTRAQPHKNLAVLGPAAQVLKERYQFDVTFVLTLTDEEWAGLTEETRRVSFNVGPLRIAQVPALYRACTGAIFPSLTECFSATPLEALACGAPLVASDRDFVRDVVNDAAAFFEPTDPTSLASALVEVLTSPDKCTAQVARGHDIARAWPTARDRALSYADIITREAELA